jgi:hypothetical protein
MANTLYRAGAALPVFRTERVTGMNRELVYDAAGRAHYIIDRNEVVYSLADNRMAFWVSGNYLIGPGGRPAYYFDLSREDELVLFIRERAPNNEMLVRRFRDAYSACDTEAQTIIAGLGD